MSNKRKKNWPPRRPEKATHETITMDELRRREKWSWYLGFPTPRYVDFCRTAIRMGLKVTLYEARSTVSKYVTLTDDRGRSLKVRFSNHKPIHHRELAGDCDIFVGVTNLGVTTTLDAIKKVEAWIGPKVVVQGSRVVGQLTSGEERVSLDSIVGRNNRHDRAARVPE